MNKKVKVESSTFRHAATSVTISDNGYQWYTVFTGTAAQSEIIATAYETVGYKREKENHEPH